MPSPLRSWCVSLVCAAAVLAAAGPSRAGWTLSWLGHLDGDDSSIAEGLSADGRVAVGYSISGDYHIDYEPEAFRWTAGGGMTGLGFLPGHAWSEAHDASADGSVVVGYSQGAIGEHSHSDGEAFRWTEATGPVGLGYLPGDTLSWAHGVSADGAVVVGYSTDGSSPDTAFLWTEASGPTALPCPPGGTWARAEAVSADGAVVVGEWSSETAGMRAFRWTAAGGAVSLDASPGGAMTFAYDLSADGSIVVGEGGNMRAARWTEAEGVVDIVSAAQDPDSSAATAISQDGTFIVGHWRSVTPFLWDAANGAQDFQQLLVADGVNFGQGHLQGAKGVSFDGTTLVIVGEGLDPDGVGLQTWMASLVIPEPATLALVALGGLGLCRRRPRK